MAVATVSMEQLDELIERYLSKGGQHHQIEEGVLMMGDFILYDTNNTLKTIVVREVYATAWSSIQTIRYYNRCPKKYQQIIDNI